MANKIFIAGVTHGNGHLLNRESVACFQGFLQPKLNGRILFIFEGGKDGLMKYPEEAYENFFFYACPDMIDFAIAAGVDIFSQDPRHEIGFAAIYERTNKIAAALQGKVTFDFDTTSYETFEHAVVTGNYKLNLKSNIPTKLLDDVKAHQDTLLRLDQALIQQIDNYKHAYTTIVVFTGYHHLLNIKRYFHDPSFEYVRLFNEKNEEWRRATILAYAYLLVGK